MFFFEDMFLELAAFNAYFDVTLLRWAVLVRIMLIESSIHAYDFYSGVSISKLGRHRTYLD